MGVLFSPKAFGTPYSLLVCAVDRDTALMGVLFSPKAFGTSYSLLACAVDRDTALMGVLFSPKEFSTSYYLLPTPQRCTCCHGKDGRAGAGLRTQAPDSVVLYFRDASRKTGGRRDALPPLVNRLLCGLVRDSSRKTGGSVASSAC